MRDWAKKNGYTMIRIPYTEDVDAYLARIDGA